MGDLGYSATTFGENREPVARAITGFVHRGRSRIRTPFEVAIQAPVPLALRGSELSMLLGQLLGSRPARGTTNVGFFTTVVQISRA